MEVGKQRLLKAYKILSDLKANHRPLFDCNYKAIICYNLACCFQMQGDLPNCSVYLQQAVEHISSKLDQLMACKPSSACDKSVTNLTVTNSTVTDSTANKKPQLLSKSKNEGKLLS